jgi:hypothetical protein
MMRIRLVARDGTHFGDADIPPFKQFPNLTWAIDRSMKVARYFMLEVVNNDEAALRLGAPHATYREVEFTYAIPYMVGEEPA